MSIRKNVKIFFTITIILIIVSSAGLVLTCEYMYNTAFELIEQGDYTGAYDIFAKLGKYRDADSEITKFRYVPINEKIISTTNGEIIYDATLTFLRNDQNLPSVLNLGADGSEKRIEYTYDDKGKVIKITTTDSKGNCTVEEYTYDEQGNRIKHVKRNSEGNELIDEYTYDENGKELTYTRINYSGERESIEYTYNEKGDCILEITTGATGESKLEYTYDDKGNLTLLIKTDKKGLQTISEYTYDECNYRIQQISTNPRGEKTVYLYEYDLDYKYQKQVITYSSGNVIIYEYTFDDNDNLIKYVLTNTTGSKYVLEYTFDANDNLIKVTSTDDGDETVLYFEYEFVYIPIEFEGDDYKNLILSMTGL